MDGGVAGVSIELRDVDAGAGAVCEPILAALPEWFGIDEANAAYVVAADLHPSVIASVSGSDVGLTTVVRHHPESAEIHLMAVLPEFHRQGIGGAMLDRVERGLLADGVQYLQVKTLDASDPHVGYAATRAFYLRCGFRPLEVFPLLWGPEDPALQMVKALTQNQPTKMQKG
jgi:GNAT superfamily N-acetyltransferase